MWAIPVKIDKGTVGKCASVSLSIGWTGFTMRPALERRGRSRMRIEAVIVRTLESAPKDATHWSSRGMAKASGLSTSSVQRIWRAFGLQPHRLETFKLSTDRGFVAKVRDVVGLYLSPPEHAIVLCVDENSQIRPSTAASPCCPCGQASRRG
jgi:hypothetical protein